MTTTARPIPMGMFIGSYLSFSETFIYDQLKHQQRLHSHVMAYAGDPAAGARFPYRDVIALGPGERALYLATGRSPRFSSALERAEVRLVHAHFGTNGVYAARFARKLDIPLAVTFHGHDVSGLLPCNRFTTRYARYQIFSPRMFDYASLLVCASQELADILVNEVGAPEKKIVVHRLGVNMDRFRPIAYDSGPAKVLMVGRFVEKKGFEYGIRAFAKVLRLADGATLRIVGDGPLSEELRALVASLGIEKAVAFEGVLDSDGVRDVMQQCNVFVAPSVVARNQDRESGVIVIKEANASGLPAVGTLHGGIPEIIDDEQTGFLVPERDVDTLAERIGRLVLDPGMRKQMGGAARAKMEREYDTVKQNAGLESLLTKLL